jgi:hypothetical protein
LAPILLVEECLDHRLWASKVKAKVKVKVEDHPGKEEMSVYPKVTLIEDLWININRIEENRAKCLGREVCP